MRNYVLGDVICDNLKYIKDSIAQCLQITDLALVEGDHLTLADAKDGIVTSKPHVAATMNLAKGITEKVETSTSSNDDPPGLSARSESSQRSS